MKLSTSREITTSQEKGLFYHHLDPSCKWNLTNLIAEMSSFEEHIA